MKAVPVLWLTCLVVCFGAFGGMAYASDTGVAYTNTSHSPDVDRNNADTNIHSNTHANSNHAKTPESAKQDLQELLLSDDYSKIQETSKWAKKEEAYEPEDTRNSWLMRLIEWLGLESLERMSQSLGLILKILALALLALIIYFLMKYRHALSSALSRIIKKDKPAVKSFSVVPRADISDNLPDKSQFANTVQQLIDEGRYLMALSLLYRGTLRELSLAHDLLITHSQTEAQCQLLLATARRHFGGEAVFFDNLVGIWQEAAYGKRLPAEPKIRLTKLNQDWQALYHRHGKSSKGEAI